MEVKGVVLKSLEAKVSREPMINLFKNSKLNNGHLEAGGTARH
jgi:hypothetical protein